MNLSGTQIKDTYGNLVSIGTVAGTPTTGTLQNGAGSDLTSITLNGAAVFNEGGADFDFRVEGLNDTNLLFVDASTDRVGIGTNTPASIIDVSSQDPNLILRDSRTSATWSAGTALGKLDFYTSDVTGIGAHSIASIGVVAGGTNTASPDGELVFSTGPYNTAATERLRIDSSGNVGIGTSSPAQKLDVNGVSVFRGALYLYDTEAGGGLGILYNNGLSGVDNVAIRAGGADRLTVLGATGNVGIGTSSPAKTLDVSGEIRASTGILFGTDTAAANTLDDYEQGTFTPVIEGGTSTGTGTYTAQVGRYTKIGNKVTYEAYLLWTNHTGTGDFRVTIPLTSVNTGASYYASCCIGSASNIALTANNIMTGIVFDNRAYAEFGQYPVGGGASSAVPIDTAGLLVFSVTYEAA
jgi:hypothetical protein